MGELIAYSQHPSYWWFNIPTYHILVQVLRMLLIFRYKTEWISRSINPTKDNLLWQSHFVNPSSDVIDRLPVSFLCIIYLKAEYDNQKLSLPYNSSSLLETIFPISKFLCTLQAARNDPHLPKTLPSTPNSSEKLWASSNHQTLPKMSTTHA